MTISRSSWHYKLYRYIHYAVRGPRYLNPFSKTVFRPDTFDLPKSLCPYTWSLIIGSIGLIPIFTVFVVVAPLYFFFIGLVALLVAAATHGPHAKLTRGVREWWRNLPEEDAKPEKEKKKRESLIAANVRAIKQKACPTITLVD